jgi:hypothetical protein
MKKAIIIFSVLFATIILNSCTSDDFENQITKSDKDFNMEVDYSLYARVGDTIIEGTNYATEGTESDPVIVIKKD